MTPPRREEQATSTRAEGRSTAVRHSGRRSKPTPPDDSKKPKGAGA